MVLASTYLPFCPKVIQFRGTASAFLMTLLADAPSVRKIFKLKAAASVRGVLLSQVDVCVCAHPLLDIDKSVCL